jgi:hypothetical protein
MTTNNHKAADPPFKDPAKPRNYPPPPPHPPISPPPLCQIWLRVSPMGLADRSSERVAVTWAYCSGMNAST